SALGLPGHEAPAAAGAGAGAGACAAGAGAGAAPLGAACATMVGAGAALWAVGAGRSAIPTVGSAVSLATSGTAEDEASTGSDAERAEPEYICPRTTPAIAAMARTAIAHAVATRRMEKPPKTSTHPHRTRVRRTPSHGIDIIFKWLIR